MSAKRRTSPWSPAFQNWILTAIAILAVLFIWTAREMLGPLVIGSLLAFILNPAVRYLERRTKLPHTLMVSLVVLTGLALIIGSIAWITPTLINQAQLVADDLLDFLNNMQDFVAEPFALFDFTIDLRNVVPDLSQLVLDSLSAVPTNAALIIEGTSRNLIWGAIILATTFYLLRDWERLRNWAYGLVPETEKRAAGIIYHELNEIWLGYFRGNLFLMLVVAIAFSLAWSLIGLPGAVILGILAGVLSIIPDIGPLISALIAILVALVEGSSNLPISNFWFGVLVTVIYLVLINIKGIWLRPLVFSRAVHIHDGLIFIALLATVVLWGILAAIIIVPILASVGTLARYVYARTQGLAFEARKF
jgi:predicted PurR-regulated permease PerM